MSGDPASWRPVRRVRAHEEVIAQIEEQIVAGQLRAGDRLPGERQLSSLLGVSRTSVREALRVLEAMGVVVSRNGSGPDAGATIAAAPSEAMTSLLRLHVGLSNFSMAEVVQARHMIERWAASMAAVRVSADDKARMRAALDRMDDLTLTPAEFNEYDTEFHVALADASGNRLVGEFMHALRDSVRIYAIQAVERLGHWPDGADVLRQDHRHIYDAVVAGDPDQAARAIADHLSHAYPEVDPAGTPG